MISGKPAFLESILDITDRKRAEDAMQKAYFELEQKVEERTKELSHLLRSPEEVGARNRVLDALAASEEKYRSLVEQIGDIVFHIDERRFYHLYEPACTDKYGHDAGTSPEDPCTRSGPQDYHEALRKFLDPALSEHPRVSGFEISVPKPSRDRLLYLR